MICESDLVDTMGWLRSLVSEDDPGVRFDAAALKMVEGFRAGNYIDIGSDEYQSYFRGRLITMTDPAAVALKNELDKRFRLT